MYCGYADTLNDGRPTDNRGRGIPEAETNPVVGLQGDHGFVAFRNIYVRPLRWPIPSSTP